MTKMSNSWLVAVTHTQQQLQALEGFLSAVFDAVVHLVSACGLVCYCGVGGACILCNSDLSWVYESTSFHACLGSMK